MNKTLRQKQKEQALIRMHKLNLMKEVIDDFKNNDTVYYSERQNAFFKAILYWVSNEDKYVEIINEFEKSHNALVYHCQLTHLEFGDVLSLFFVSEYEDEWEQDNDDIKEGQALVYAANLDDDMFSELGYIGFESTQGGVCRTW